MAYDEEVARRLRTALLRARPQEPVDERKMFGGIALMVGGRMCCGVSGTDMVVRVGEVGADEALRQPHARPMDFTGKPMRSFVYVAPAGFASEATLDAWVARGLAGAREHAAKAAEKATRTRKPAGTGKAPAAGAKKATRVAAAATPAAGAKK